jgi:hypothetical protein
MTAPREPVQEAGEIGAGATLGVVSKLTLMLPNQKWCGMASAVDSSEL